MPWKYTDEYYQEYTRTTWNDSAGAYRAIMGQFKPFHDALVAGLRPRTGESVLDLACGPGEPALSIARRVGPQGEVIGVDLSEKMVRLAHRAARAAAVSNVAFRVMNCEKLEFPDARFDAVESAFGFQIFTDPEKAAREAHRVLRPGGRIAVCVWSTAERVPFLNALVGPMLAHAEPDETGYLPTPFETGGPGEMVEFLRRSGFRAARERRLRQELHYRDPKHYLDTILGGTPLGHSLREETPKVQREVLAATRKNLEAWRTPSGLVLPGECVFVTAKR